MAGLVSRLLALSVYLFAGFSPGICDYVSVSEQGLRYSGGLEIFPEHLFVPFPSVYVDAGGGVIGLANSVAEDTIPFVSVGNTRYRNVSMQLSLQPYTPDTLIPYISAYWDSWGENRIPYVGEWRLSLEEQTNDGWIKHAVSGVIAPSCLRNVDDSLLADADFNGVPSAFWNYNVERAQ